MSTPSKRQNMIEKLRNVIRSGKYQPGEKFPSEYELASLYNINRITVNKAVNILVEEGYLERASSSRAGTIVRKTHIYPEGIIGYITTLRDNFTSMIAIGAAQTAVRNNYLLSLATPNFDEIGDTLRNMEAAGCKGILSVHYGKFNTSLPVVYIDESCLPITSQEDMVICNNFSGGEMIAEHVINSGHRDIVYLCKVHQRNHINFRRDGVLATMARHGITDAATRCFTCNDDTPHHCTQALHEIRSRYPDFSAIICNTDYLALNVIRAGQQLGLDIPGKIAITGFGNVREIQELFHFTTIEQHPKELGIKACERLLQITEKKSGQGISLVDVELITGNRFSNFKNGL